jgi:putative transposase
MNQTRFSAEQKFNIILESLRGDRSISEICREYGIAQSVFYKWRDKFFEGARNSFRSKKKLASAYESEVRQLKQVIGELTIENQILKKTQKLLGQS